nr:hypothetical protein Iba_chr04aCG6410 [Ipomoea batatas]
MCFIQYTHKHRGWKYFLPIKTVGNYTFSTSDFSDNKNDLVINEISEDDVNDFRDQIRLLSLMPSDPKNTPLDGETEEKILRNVKSIIIWEDSGELLT